MTKHFGNSILKNRRPGLLALLGLAFTAAPSSRAVWRKVECLPPAQLMEDDFVKVAKLADFESGGPVWRALAGGQNAKTRVDVVPIPNGHALKVSYEFLGKQRLEYVEISCPYVFRKPGYGIGFRIRNLSAAPLTMRCRVRDPSGETLQKNIGRLAVDDKWHFMAAMLAHPEGAWGGNGNHLAEYPLAFVSILADHPRSGYRKKGAFLIDDIYVIRKRKPSKSLLTVEADPRRPGNIYDREQPFRLRVKAARGTVRWEVRDYWDRTCAVAGVPPAGGSSSLIIQWPAYHPGYYRFIFHRIENGQTVETREFHFGVLPPWRRPVSDPFFCVQAHFHQHWNPRIMDLIARLGAYGFRDEVTWSAVEKKKGVLAIPALHQAYRRRASQLGLDILVILDYGNRFYDNGGYPISPEAVRGYARYAYTVADAWYPDVKNFEIWNEYTGGCGMAGKPKVQTPETYYKMLAAAATAIHTAHPDDTIVGIGGDHSGYHYKVIRAKLAAGCLRYMDKLSVHSYRQNSTPEASDLVGELARVHDLIRRYGGKQPIWITEIGWPTDNTGGVDEQTQARDLVRTYVLCKSLPFIERVYWYDFKDDGTQRGNKEHNFGILHYDQWNWAVKPAAVAFSVMAHELENAVPVRRSRRGALYACRFRKDGRDVIVAWNAAGAPGKIVLPAAPVRAVNIVGESFTVPARAGTPAAKAVWPVALSPDPVYLIGNFPGPVKLAPDR